MTANKLAVPEWEEIKDMEKGDREGVKGMDMDRGEEENHEVKIKREQIEASAGRTKTKTIYWEPQRWYIWK